ncbi:glycosyltransferase [Variovorax sp. 38R]|uniref:glycosyltransferase n=1 Tax=Variovorax sp. 38R TaxID=2774875 RepID=UPI00177F341A|nr:glycosyltransferase [Variovorax sp. 38R]QOF79650.1 glycosyltransferase [Variovorax sp. 38R]
MKTRRVEYFSCFNPQDFPGIFRKIDDSVLSLRKSGLDAENRNFLANFRGFIDFAFSLFKTNADVVVVRNFFQIPIFFPVFVYLRLRRKYLVIDIPTPLAVVLKEFDLRERMSKWAIRARKGMVSLFYPYALFPFNRVIHYAEESAYFSFGLKGKIELMANGIDVERYELKKKDVSLAENSIVLLAVAKVSAWHGFDRVLSGISNYVSSKSADIDLKLYIAGDGDEIENLKKIAERLKISENVSFLGFKSHNQLGAYFDIADIGVSSLGLHRKGLDSASSLKTREYAARGLPMIVSGQDLDLLPNPHFAHLVPNSDEPIDMLKVIRWYESLPKNGINREVIRSFALERMDFKNKVKFFLP